MRQQSLLRSVRQQSLLQPVRQQSLLQSVRQQSLLQPVRQQSLLPTVRQHNNLLSVDNEFTELRILLGDNSDSVAVNRRDTQSKRSESIRTNEMCSAESANEFERLERN